MSNDIETLLEEAKAPYEHGRLHAVLYGQTLTTLSKAAVQHSFLASSCLHLNVTGDKHKLEAIWSALRKLGYEPPAERPKANTPQFSGHFHHVSGATVFLYFTSTSCRVVRTGSKMVEAPVYEVVCGETELAAQA